MKNLEVRPFRYTPTCGSVFVPDIFPRDNILYECKKYGFNGSFIEEYSDPTGKDPRKYYFGCDGVANVPLENPQTKRPVKYTHRADHFFLPRATNLHQAIHDFGPEIKNLAYRAASQYIQEQAKQQQVLQMLQEENERNKAAIEAGYKRTKGGILLSQKPINVSKCPHPDSKKGRHRWKTGGDGTICELCGAQK